MLFRIPNPESPIPCLPSPSTAPTASPPSFAAKLGTLVREAVAEHGLPSVSVSDVEVTRDLAHAKVFVTALQGERAAEALKG